MELCRAAIECRVDHDRHGIVAGQIGVALRELGRDRLGIPRTKRHVEMRRVVQQQGFSADIGQIAAPRFVLNEGLSLGITSATRRAA